MYKVESNNVNPKTPFKCEEVKIENQVEDVENSIYALEEGSNNGESFEVNQLFEDQNLKKDVVKV